MSNSTCPPSRALSGTRHARSLGSVLGTRRPIRMRSLRRLFSSKTRVLRRTTARRRNLTRSPRSAAAEDRVSGGAPRSLDPGHRGKPPAPDATDRLGTRRGADELGATGSLRELGLDGRASHSGRSMRRRDRGDDRARWSYPVTASWQRPSAAQRPSWDSARRTRTEGSKLPPRRRPSSTTRSRSNTCRPRSIPRPSTEALREGAR